MKTMIRVRLKKELILKGGGDIANLRIDFGPGSYRTED